MNDIDLESYKLSKFLLSIIFDTKSYEIYKGGKEVSDINFVICFKDVIDRLVSRNYLSTNLKNNIYKILLDLREIKDDNREKRIQIINDIIGTVNSQDFDDSLTYYRIQLYYRKKDKSFLKKYSDNEIEEYIDYVNESIANDFLVMCLLVETNLEDFKNDCMDELVNNLYFYESVDSILRECPDIFNDKVVLDKIDLVFQHNSKFDRCFNKENKKIKRKMKKIFNINEP